MSGISLSFDLEESSAQTVAERVASSGLSSAQPIVSRGLLRPFRRDGQRDFNSGTGRDLVASNVGQILGTKCATETEPGELEWNQEFGSRLHRLRHRNPRTALYRELARRYSVDAIRRWEPRARVTDVQILTVRRTTMIRVLFDEVDTIGNVVRGNLLADVPME